MHEPSGTVVVSAPYTGRHVIEAAVVAAMDEVALDEIELTGELMIAATDSQGPLSADRIDEILGVAPAAY